MKPPGKRGAVKDVEDVMGCDQSKAECNKRSQHLPFSISYRTGIW